jgi:hypothetical protein
MLTEVAQTVDLETSSRLAAALRAGDDTTARSLFASAGEGIPDQFLVHPDLGPRGDLRIEDGAALLHCVSALAAGATPDIPEYLTRPRVIDLVAEAAELTASLGRPAWPVAVLPGRCAGVPEILQARFAEGSGRTDEAQGLAEAALRAAPRLLPAIRDLMEYGTCAGNWGRAYELARLISDDDRAEPMLRSLSRLAQPAVGSERASRNQPCPCGSGRKYKMCCRAKDLEGGTHPLTLRSPALYGMLATFARRAPWRPVHDRLLALAIGAPAAAMLIVDLTIFDHGVAAHFMRQRGHLLRPDERDLLTDWMNRPVDLYEVTRIRRGSELTLRSLIGGPAMLRQRDRLFSESAERLDLVVGRLLPDGEILPDGTPYLRALGGIACLFREGRSKATALFADGPVVPGNDEEFPKRLLEIFAQEWEPRFQTADGDEYRFCQTSIRVEAADKMWRLLVSPCLPAPERPIRDLAGYHAYLGSLPPRFWTRMDDNEIEFVGQLQAGRLTNLGTIERVPFGFRLTANSVRRVTTLENVVLKVAADAGCTATATTRSVQAADELAPSEAKRDKGPGGREATCERMGIATQPPESRGLILEQYFYPLESTASPSLVNELNRDLAIGSMLDGRNDSGRTPAEAIAAGGAARDEVLAMIDDCEWRIIRKRRDGEDASFMPDPGELRRRLGLPVRGV